jgi:hypothetical protein
MNPMGFRTNDHCAGEDQQQFIKTTVLDQKYKMPGLHHLLKHKTKAQKIMARNPGSSMQSSSELGCLKYQENGSE